MSQLVYLSCQLTDCPILPITPGTKELQNSISKLSTNIENIRVLTYQGVDNEANYDEFDYNEFDIKINKEFEIISDNIDTILYDINKLNEFHSRMITEIISYKSKKDKQTTFYTIY